MKSNVLKKITIGNPLINFGKQEEFRRYQEIDNDEELAKFYHQLLDECPEKQTTYESFIYAMIGFSTGVNINTKHLFQI